MSAADRDELARLVQELPDEAVPELLAEARRRLAAAIADDDVREQFD